MKEIPLTQGKVALVDDADWPMVSEHKWRAAFIRGKWYAVATVDGNNNTYLHRFITNAPRGLEIDHVDGSGLDCRRENMRLATRKQNAQNLQGAHRDSLTGIRGVTFDKHSARYHALVVVDGRNISLGYHTTLAAAGQAAITGRQKYMTHAPECADVKKAG